MQTSVLKSIKVDAAFVEIEVFGLFEDRYIPFDFPLRDGDLWKAQIVIDNGQILDWPRGEGAFLYMNVKNEGTYRLLNRAKETISIIENDCIPGGLIPREYADFLKLDIDNNGIVRNWPTDPNVDEFFNDKTASYQLTIANQ